MQEQYSRLKAECGDAFLFFRLGDFFELFDADAERAAPILEVVLTSREASPGVRRPMCGVPYHAVDTYAARLLARGHKVAIADQVEDPAQARGLVRREIVRLLTPGTLTEPALLESLGDSLLAALAEGPALSLAVADASTGSVRVAVLEGDDPEGTAWDELCRLRPRELVVPAAAVPAVARRYAEREGAVLSPVGPGEAQAGAARATWGEAAEGAPAALDLLAGYLARTLRGVPGAWLPPERYRPSGFMGLDAGAQRNLELVERLGGGGAGTLFSVLDRTVTPMGRRLLRFWLLHPLLEPEAVAARQEAVGELVRQPLFREGLRAALRGVYDLERLAARTVREQCSPRELAALGASLRALPEALQALAGCQAPLLRAERDAADPLADVAEQLGRALVDQPPAAVREGGIFRQGHDALLDEWRQAGGQARQWLAELEERERGRTGIRSLKVGFNKVFGYYLEVSAANLRAVPAEWQRRQTLAGGERFVTPELKALEERILGAEERAQRREQTLFAELRAAVARRGAELQRTARAVATLDVLAALADVAVRRGWVRPVVDRSLDLVVRGGRHPVIEQALGRGRFVPNDLRLEAPARRFLLISGPNMAGKSTFMRQAALLTILAQMGSFVPATEARVGVCDRIFTRIGASDDLAGGRSTFMVEMTEVATLLRQASHRSLLLLDEVGRGTGTLDGLAIACAVAEDVAQRLRARTLFATHYHELTALADALPGTANVHVAVREEAGDVVFLHRVVDGATDRSYGVAVAALAGVPAPVIARARQLLQALQGGTPLHEAAGLPPATPAAPVATLPAPVAALLQRLAAVEILRTTPLQALDLLALLQADALTVLDDATATPSPAAPAGERSGH
jgi:DNA mismatch repair protein MutS